MNLQKLRTGRMNNVMRTGNRRIRERRGFCIGLACAVIFVIMVLLCAAPSGLVYLYFENVGMTREAEDNLTRLQGAEVTRAIEKFERTWFSLDAYRNPAIQGEVATARLIDYLGVEKLLGAKAISWYVQTSASVTAVRVLAYDVLRFKAIACVRSEWATVSKDGTILESEPLDMHRRLYVFVREGESWKADATFDMTRDDWVERAWRNEIPEWEKQAIGELPEGAEPNCWEPTPISP